MTMETISEHRCLDGIQGSYRHASEICAGVMRFAVFQLPQAQTRPVPVLYYLAGLSCTEETFMVKAGAQRVAAELGLMLVAPDTSPRETRYPGDDGSWDFGLGAGSYVDATERPWSDGYRMDVASELPALVAANFPAAGKAYSATPWVGTARLRSLSNIQSGTNRFPHSRPSRPHPDIHGGPSSISRRSSHGPPI